MARRSCFPAAPKELFHQHPDPDLYGGQPPVLCTVSSEARYDKCTIRLGSTILVDGESGEQDWKGLEVDAKKGDKLTVEYKKDSGKRQK